MLRRLEKVLLGTSLALTMAAATAEVQILECKLYIAESLDHASAYSIDSTESTLSGLRRGGICLFADGSIADKQFVMGTNTRQNGSAGDAVGISVYTFDSGDSLTLSFSGGWEKGPFSGEYTILRGTGIYEGASGDGTISGLDGPWKSTSIVNIKINVVTTGE